MSDPKGVGLQRVYCIGLTWKNMVAVYILYID